jgi:hypothetical protein
MLKPLSYGRTQLTSSKKLEGYHNENEKKSSRTIAPLTQAPSTRHLRLNKRGGRPGANVSPIDNRLQHDFTVKSLPSNLQRLTHSGQDPCPTGTSKTLQMPPSRTNITNNHSSNMFSATTQPTPQASKNMRCSKVYRPINMRQMIRCTIARVILPKLSITPFQQ